MTIALALIGAAAVVALGLALGREAPRRPWVFFTPVPVAFVALAPAAARTATESAGDSALMIGVVIGAIVGVWRGRELAPLGVRWRTGEIVAGGDRLGALILGAALVAEGISAELRATAPGLLVGLLGASAGQLVGWYVGVYGRYRAERRVAAQ